MKITAIIITGGLAYMAILLRLVHWYVQGQMRALRREFVPALKLYEAILAEGTAGLLRRGALNRSSPIEPSFSALRELFKKSGKPTPPDILETFKALCASDGDDILVDVVDRLGPHKVAERAAELEVTVPEYLAMWTYFIKAGRCMGVETVLKEVGLE
jgi:hypothetical protein